MSATSGVNVLRYSALAVGVAYGFYHQRTITQHVRSQQAEREYKHKEQLINQAKAEFAKSKQPAVSKVAEKVAGGREFPPFTSRKQIWRRCGRGERKGTR
ncbi:ATP synthase E chain-domain-containing protein [Coniochaeta sp. 2T2.1]|nr:ATP synthase E chain-domain-containing protein [Coniochaeta sp. 2T2.1]